MGMLAVLVVEARVPCVDKMPGSMLACFIISLIHMEIVSLKTGLSGPSMQNGHPGMIARECLGPIRVCRR